MHRTFRSPPTLLLALGLLLCGSGADGAHAQSLDDEPSSVSLSGYAVGSGIHFRDTPGMDALFGVGVELLAGDPAGWAAMLGVDVLQEATGDYRIGFLDFGVVHQEGVDARDSRQRYLSASFTHWFGNPENPRNPEHDATRSGNGITFGAGYRFPLGPALDLDVGLRTGVGLFRRPPPSLGIGVETSEWSWALRPRVGLTWSR